MKIDFDHIPSRLSAIIETNGLKDAIAQLRQYDREQSPPKTLARKLGRVLRALAAQLARVQSFNARVWVKHDMLHDNGWRAEVTEDLGGDPALERWETRKVKAETEVIAPRIRPYVPGAQPEVFAPETGKTNPSKPRRIKTDRRGLFRLAPIRHKVRPLTDPEVFARGEAATWRKAMTPQKRMKTKRTPRFKPIPVTPEELRGETNIKRGHLQDYYTPYKTAADYSLPEGMAKMGAPAIMQAMLDFDCLELGVTPRAQGP